MGIGPVTAVRRIFERTGLSVADLDVIESNEAFAAQALAVAKELELPAERTNPNGGAIALGHPIGATGAIIVLKAAYEMNRIDGRHALAAMCVGGGQGVAVAQATPRQPRQSGRKRGGAAVMAEKKTKNQRRMDRAPYAALV